MYSKDGSSGLVFSLPTASIQYTKQRRISLLQPAIYEVGEAAAYYIVLSTPWTYRQVRALLRPSQGWPQLAFQHQQKQQQRRRHKTASNNDVSVVFFPDGAVMLR